MIVGGGCGGGGLVFLVSFSFGNHGGSDVFQMLDQIRWNLY